MMIETFKGAQLIQQLIQMQPIAEPEVATYKALGDRNSKGNPFMESLWKVVEFQPKFLDFVTGALARPPGLLPDSVMNNAIVVALDSADVPTAVYPTVTLDRLYARVVETIVKGYLQRNPMTLETARTAYWFQTTSMDEVKATVAAWVAAGEVNPCSLFVVGPSGMGKTFGVKFVLLLLPRVLWHQAYNGHDLKRIQVIRLYVECPSNCSLRALLLQILVVLDLTVGSSYYGYWLNSRANTDTLVVSVALILYLHGVGALVLDELQHLRARGFAETETLLNFFVSLMNFLRVPLISIGTYAALDVMSSAFRDARRIAGDGTIEFHRLRADEPLMRHLHEYYWSFIRAPRPRLLTPELHDRLYDIHQGIHYFLPNMVVRLNGERALRHLETVTDELLNFYQDVELIPVARALAALRANDADAIQKFDDLMSHEALEELRAFQARNSDGRGRATPTARPGLRLGPREYASDSFTDEQIERAVVQMRARFAAGDLYPQLKRAKLLTSGLVQGRL